MARPRLHHTPEAKAAADRAKWHKYYSKNRKRICKQAREKYRNTTSPSSTSSTVSSLSRQVTSIDKQFTKITGPSLREYLSGIYFQYCLEGSNSVITDALGPIEILRDNAQSLSNEILMKDGVGLAWTKADEVCKRLRSMIAMIEDILCYALFGLDEVKEAHKQGQLAYQSL